MSAATKPVQKALSVALRSSSTGRLQVFLQGKQHSRGCRQGRKKVQGIQQETTSSPTGFHFPPRLQEQCATSEAGASTNVRLVIGIADNWHACCCANCQFAMRCLLALTAHLVLTARRLCCQAEVARTRHTTCMRAIAAIAAGVLLLPRECCQCLCTHQISKCLPATSSCLPSLVGKPLAS